MYLEPLVSIIVPVYNSEGFILDTLQSILNQTYSNFEVIIVNDGSTDNTKNLLSQFIYNKSRFKLYDLKINQGVDFSRNYALRVSKGEYVAFLDSDDIWLPKKLENQIKFHQETRALFTYTSIFFINELSIKYKSLYRAKYKIDYFYLLKHTIISTSTVMIHKSIYDNLEMPKLKSGQDYASWLQILKNGHFAYGLNEKLVGYRVRKNSLSKNKWNSIKQVFFIQTTLFRIPKLNAVFNTFFYLINAIIKRLSFLIKE